MSIYEVTFEREDGQQRFVRVKAPGILSAIKGAVDKSGFEFMGWEIIKAEKIGDSKRETIRSK